MAFLSVSNVRLQGISACVPKRVQENISLHVFHSDKDAGEFIASTGVERRRIADTKTTTSDLCYCAAEKLASDLGWQRETIDCLIFVTQSPDYLLPATSCILQDRLGLSEECYALDISLGCSGWVYGMSVIANLLSGSNFKRGLLLCGDTPSKAISEKDKSAWPLFGDAGTATALEYTVEVNKMDFHLATDGSGYDAILIPDGGYRNITTKESLEYCENSGGEFISRNRLQVILNGMDVFSFGITKAPQSVNKLLEHIGLERETVDYYLFHQANKFMNENIRKKLKLTVEQVPYSLRDFGNTSSATIPLTMVTELREKLQTESLKMMGCGFGVGLSWGSIYFETDKIICPQLIEV
jgi:3-oxoacyl-[acyl-carrier-protein] synthase III